MKQDENEKARGPYAQPITTPEQAFDTQRRVEYAADGRRLDGDEYVEPRHAHHRGSQPHSKTSAMVAIAVGVVLLGTGGGFFAGYQIGKANMSNTSSQTRTGGFGNGQTSDGSGTGGQTGRGGGMRNGVFGTVTAISDSSITVKDQMQDVSTTYAITSSTTVTNNGATASVSDIATGDTVLIRATSSSSSSSDGSSSDSSTKTAKTIEINPSMPSSNGSSSDNSNSSSSSSDDNSSSDSSTNL